MHRGDHVWTVPRALLHEIESGHTHHFGAVHVRVQHLGAERDQPFGEQLRRALIVLVFNHFRGIPEALQASHGTAVRQRDDVRFVPRRIKTEHGAH